MNILRPLAFAAAMLGATGAAQAAPILYDINFTVTDGGVMPSFGSFMYDSTTQTFSNFIVDFFGHPFDLTAAANAPINDGTCGGLFSGFAIMSGTTGCPTNQLWSIIARPAISLLIFSFYASGDPSPPYPPSEEIVFAENDVVPFVHGTLGTFTISAAVPEPPSLLPWVIAALAAVGYGIRRSGRLVC